MSRTPRRWTEQEDTILRQEALSQPGYLLVEESDLKDWHRIAKKLPGRSNKDCRKRWCNNVTAGLKKGQWEEDEDSRLESGIQKHGHHWAAVSQEVETRSADQCAKRWSHCLNPALDRSSWSKEEDQKLMDAVKMHGHSWKYIQTTSYPGRATNHVKNRYTILSRKSKTQQQQPHLPLQDPSQPSDITSTPASSSYQDDEFSRMLEDSNEAMPDFDSQPTSPTLMNAYPSAHPFPETMPQQHQQRPQWTYSPNNLSVTTERPNPFVSNPLDLPPHVPTGPSTQSATKALNPMYVDPTLDLAPTWPHHSTLAPDQQPMNYFPDDLLAGTLSPASSALLPSASSYLSSARPSSSFTSSGLLESSSRPSIRSTDPSKSSLSTIQPYTTTPSSRNQAPPITDNTTTTTNATAAAGSPTPNTVVETTSNTEAMKEASKLSPSSSSTLTLTIEDPNSETMTDLMGILAKSKAKMKLEVS